jgi:predicted RNase H-like nuclease (RuvC/YqgF family)
MSFPVVSTVGSSTSILPEGVNQMQRQVVTLQRHLAVERQSSNDAETRTKRIRVIEIQIQQLQSRLLQKETNAKMLAVRQSHDDLTPKDTKLH